MKKVKKFFNKILENYGKMGEMIPIKYWNRNFF